MMPAYKQANRERDELRERYEGEREECRRVREEMARLEEEVQMMSRMQAEENAEMGSAQLGRESYQAQAGLYQAIVS
jgi:predicted  nucleic acid-binding Zn-ribbon protein